ncbi:hypothetical protein DL1_21100 [Thioclava dalianensis]|uniref:Uncharacterized protein n=1 Tax=Thioclava dalianensis TaxID=1185766 RepID=A0A074TIK9_9RHOB|nr:hypothetical protein [Thioclava dalianensis]KEP70000.1 hypothetical protein DL1_21100 [Thioclava dalianensis]SFN18600.1 hypothetical protein SAMN05216224_102868 [Thioclava dalianensis]
MTQAIATQETLLDMDVTFIQNDIPGFEAGIYRLSLSQELSDDTGATINDAPIELTYDFAVSGDRFAFAQPDQSVFAVFPPDNSSGEYDAVFPHAVFPQSNLPWLRSPTKTHAEPDALGDIPTWLWVMLLDEGDVAESAALEPKAGVIGDLFPQSVYDKSTLGTGESYFSDGGDLSDLEPGQTMESAIQYIDVPLSLFWELAPTLPDLALMAHVREVSLIEKPTIAKISDQGVALGKFSIAFGNRLPQNSANSRCYLVSLEGLEDYLPTSEDGGAPTSHQDGAQLLRLAVLRHWRFRSTGQPAGFVNALLDLNAGTQNASGEKRTVLQLPYEGSNPTLKAGFEMGYVPLDTQMRTGEKTLSWYRGPLAPYATQVAPPDLPLSSADAGLIFDPTSGMFDMSYASAWTIGRLIALQDQSFSVPLYVWKRDIHHQLLASVSGDILAAHLADLAPVALPQALATRLGLPATRNAAAQLSATSEAPLNATRSFNAAHHLMIHALAGRK